MTQPPPDGMLSYSKSPEGIRTIAAKQRGILLCILAQFILYGTLIAGESALPVLVRLAFALVMLGVDVVAMVFVFQLTTKLYGLGMGIFLGILTLVPCINLIMLLVVNAKATALLKQNGLKVGLLGAKIPDHF